MFAAIVRSNHDMMALAATLGSLIEGTAAGLIGHAVVILPALIPPVYPLPEAAGMTQPPSHHDTRGLAEATGADTMNSSGNIQADWRMAALMARGDWVVTLEAGEIFSHGWIAALERHAITSGGRVGFVARKGWRGIFDMAQARLFPGAIHSGHVIARASILSGVTANRPAQLHIRRESSG